MKFYQSIMILTIACSPLAINAWWPTWIDTISSKFNNITDVIVHKEFNQAKKLELTNQTGTMVIHSWKQKSIAIEVITSCPESSHKDIKISMECINDIVTVHTNIADEKIKASVLFNILVPKETAITAMTKQGDIIIKDVNSTIHITTDHGDITLINPQANVTAKTGVGNISIQTEALHPSKTFDIYSKKGNISLYTSPGLNSSIHASALQGKISSNVLITLDRKTTLLNAQAWKNFKQVIGGTVGQPLADITMIAENGSIDIIDSTKKDITL